jgi:succinyl-diaminopimelate desuccinylase
MMKESDLSSAIEKIKEYAIELTRDLIRIPTVNPPGRDYERCAFFLADTLRSLGVEVDLVPVPKDQVQVLAPHGEGLPRVNVLGRLRGSKGKPVLHLSGHYDVVPPGDGWDSDPFDPVIKDGRIAGRGSVDMKSGIASIIAMFKLLKDQSVGLRGDVTASFVPDEETGGQAGAGFIVKEGLVKADYAILTEPAGPEVVKLAQKGALWLEVSTIGKAAHGAFPFLGINAFDKMMKVYCGLKDLQTRLSKRITTFPADIQHQEAKQATMNIGGIVRGGQKINIVPDRCTITIDRRLNPEENIEEAYAEINDIFERLKREDPELKIEVKTLLKAASAAIPREEKICTSLAGAIRKALKRDVKYWMTPGFMDMRYFVRDGGIPMVSYGPGGLTHVANESVAISDVVDCIKVLSIVAMDLLE